MLQGEYRYDSSAFWDVVPMITAMLFVVAVIANWATTRRWILLAAFGLFVAAGVLAGVFLEPEFASITAAGYRDTVDPELQRRAAQWYKLDWGVWTLSLAAGLLLLVAMLRPVTKRNSGNESDAF